jgi:hypothetical protein
MSAQPEDRLYLQHHLDAVVEERGVADVLGLMQQLGAFD